ncbi:MAG: type II toxin-antitoxin system Phd/YefM family antitoxin [Gammaproteobacteria bacterium]
MSSQAVSLADAKARLSERAARGETIVITRRGKPIARLTKAAEPRRPIKVATLRSVTRDHPRQAESAGRFLRRLRDTSRF